MASKEQRKFIDNLQNFSDALEDVVEALKQQTKTKETDLIDSLLQNLDGNKIKKLISNVEEIKKDTNRIDKKIDKLLKIQTAAKEAKETGMFGDVSSIRNKDKIIDGIKVVTLIAGGVLAMGFALKLIKDVDYKTVLSFSVSIIALAGAFAIIAKDKDLSTSKAFKAGLVMIIMAGATFLAAKAISKIPPITINQGFTAIMVAAALGGAIFLLSKALDKSKLKFTEFVKLPIIMPILAFAVSQSSEFLSQIKEISAKQGLTAILIAGAMGVAIYLLATGLSKVKIKFSQMMMLPLIIPIVAASIVVASHILKQTADISFKDMLNIIMATIAISVSAVIFGAALWVMSKFDKKTLLQGALATIIVSAAIFVTSWILSAGNYDKYPSLDWAVGTGLSLLGFGINMVLLGLVIMSGVGLPVLGLGALGVLIVSAAIVASSYILNTGSYEKFPSLGWASGVGMSLAAFGTGMMILGGILMIPLVGAFIMKNGQEAVLNIATTIVIASRILNKGTYDKYPSLGWALGVGTAVASFTSAFILVKGIESLMSLFGGKKSSLNDFIVTTAKAMFDASNILAGGNWSQGYPSKEWSEGVGSGIFYFAKAFAAVGALQGLMKLMGSKQSLNTFITSSAESMVVASMILTKGNWSSGYPTKDWSEGVAKSIYLFSLSFEKVYKNKSLFGSGLNKFLVNIIKAMVDGSILLKNGEWSDISNIKSWSESISGIISEIINIMKQDDVEDMIEDFVDAINEFSNLEKSSIDNLNYLANSMRNLSGALSGLDTSKIDAISKIGSSFLVISVIDQQQLEKTLSVIEAKSNAIKKIVDINSNAGRMDINNASAGSLLGGTTQINTNEVVVRDMDKLLSHIINIDTNIGQMSKVKAPNQMIEEPISNPGDVHK